VLPEDIAYWTYVEQTARRFASLYGYGELRTPTIEETNLFTRGAGEATDVVEKEMYSFTDKGGSDITLRAEGTAPIMRAYLQHGMHARPQPGFDVGSDTQQGMSRISHLVNPSEKN